jgi:2-dehydropantoate 2-reductase
LGVYRPPTGKLVLKNTAEEEGLLKGFEEIVTAGGGRVEIVPDVQPVKFAKNLWWVTSLHVFSELALIRGSRQRNTSFAAASTLIRAPLPTFFATKETRDRIISVVRNLLREAVDVARAVGYTEDVVPSSLIEWNIQDNETRNGLGTTSTHRPSMLVDLESGKPLELEVVVGEVVRMGREKNVAIPTLETVYGLLSVVQNNLIRESAK